MPAGWDSGRCRRGGYKKLQFCSAERTKHNFRGTLVSRTSWYLLACRSRHRPPPIDRGSTIDPHRNLYRNCCFPRSTLLLLLTMQNLLYFPPAPGKVNLSPAVYSRLGFSSSVPHAAAAAAAALNHHQQLQIKSSHQLDLDRLNLP